MKSVRASLFWPMNKVMSGMQTMPAVRAPALRLPPNRRFKIEQGFGFLLRSDDVRCPSNFAFQRAALMPPCFADPHAC